MNGQPFQTWTFFSPGFTGGEVEAKAIIVGRVDQGVIGEPMMKCGITPAHKAAYAAPCWGQGTLLGYRT